jgi:hypothetical protein
MNRFIGVFFHWLPLGVAVIFLGGLLYTTVQQNYRQNLYDPQVQLVEDAVTGLSAGKIPTEVVPHTASIDATKSLATFMTAYDKEGNVIATNGTIGADQPKPPQGVFDYAREHGENRLTWQPVPNARIAIVMKKTDNGFIMAGRNMREVESRINMLAKRTALGTLFILLATFVADLIGDAMRRKMMEAAKN